MEMGSSSGLKFGEKIYFEDSTDGHVEESRGATSSSSRKGKAAAAAAAQQQPMGRCQVEGCGVDLSGAKPYYCKHRVCGAHSKAPRVIVAGMEQRFCQQCSRFHQLSEFDQGKRSCRRRLAGHNERRRKPPSGPLSAHTRHFSPFFHEDNSRSRGFVMDFTRPRSAFGFGSNQPASNLSLQGGAHPYMQDPTTNQYLSPSTTTTTSGETLGGMPSSSCALSLLSSPVLWGGPHATAGDSLSSSWQFRSAHDANSNHYNRHGSSPSIPVQQNFRVGPIDGTENNQYSGELESALHRNRRRRSDDPSRGFGHSDDDVIHWSL